MEYDVYMPINFKLGRPLKYKPDELFEKFKEYVQWAKEHPIPIVRRVTNTTTKGDTYGSDSVEHKPRLLSVDGFLVYLGAERNWWTMLEKGKRGEEFLKVKSIIRGFCEDYQKEMASAEIFNANIISRLLGLADKQMVKNEEKIVIVNSQEEMDKLNRLKDIED